MRTLKVKTKSQSGRKPGDKSPHPAPRLEQLAIDRIEPTSDNRRKPISRASIESLAKSIKSDGVLQPVIVRPHSTRSGHFELRAGERRWRAAKLAGLTRIPAIIRTLDDVSALSVTITENTERLNLHPLEEAATIQQAFKRDFDIKAVASKLGKSEQYVARRASLTRLSKTWQAAIMKPETEASQLSPAHLELIARLPRETQELLSDRGFELVFGRGFPSVDDLRRIIDAGLHSLKAMPWRVDDDTLDPKAGSCINCPKRSSREPLLFTDEGEAVSEPASNRVPKGDRCLDPQCYENKRSAHLVRCESSLRASHPQLQVVQVTYERLSPMTHKAFGDRMRRTHEPLAIKAKGKGSVPVMAVDGPKAGRLMYVSAPAGQNGHAASQNKGKSAKRKEGPATPAERKERLQRRRDAYFVKFVEGVLRKLADGDYERIARHLTRENRPKGEPSVDLLALILAFGTSTRKDRHTDGDAWSEHDRIRGRSEGNRTIHAIRELSPIWARRLSGVDGSTAAAQAADAKRICAVIGLDASAIEIEAAKVIPMPKSWTMHV